MAENFAGPSIFAFFPLTSVFRAGSLRPDSMRFLKFKSQIPFFVAATVLFLGFSARAVAQNGSLVLTIRDDKSFRQTGNQRPLVFQGGQFVLAVRDGFISILPCVCNGGPFKCFPIPMLCETGTTGFVTTGDIDGDGIRDDRSFWSINPPMPAIVLDLFRANEVAIQSAPPSDLPVPLQGSFEEDNLEVWYNMLETPPTRYQMAGYFYDRLYQAGNAGLLKQRRELVEGVYILQVPVRPEVVGGITGMTLNINSTLHKMIEGYPGPSGYGTTNDWLLTEPTNWNDYTSPVGEFDRVLELDPRLFNEFKWGGFNGTTVIPTIDTVTFSMVDTTQDDLIVYPPYDPETPPGDRSPELLPGIPQGIEVGPYVMEPGMKVTARVEVQREFWSSPVAVDRSSRFFEWGVYFIDSYEGWMFARVPSVFPIGTQEEAMKPNVDFDGDGWTNLQEYAFMTQPANPASVPLIRPYIAPDTGQIVLDVLKRPDVGHSLIYEIEYSSDRVDWTTIAPGDPVYFMEFDNSERIKVRSRRFYDSDKNGFLRVKLIRT